jgi:hypothetical protein
VSFGAKSGEQEGHSSLTVVPPPHKMLDKEHSGSSSIVMAGEPLVGPEFRPFSVHRFA